MRVAFFRSEFEYLHEMRYFCHAINHVMMNSNNLRRSHWNDYQGRNIYMITLVTEGRRPLLGRLEGDVSTARVELSALGREVELAWQRLPQFHPEITSMACQVMPDHFHGILFVRRHINLHLGQVIAGFKYGTTLAFRNLTTEAEKRTLWSKGYHDRILRGQGQLQRLIDYVHDNPRRLLIKREHPDLFRVQEHVAIGSAQVAVMGNRFLLDWPEKVQVRCSRSLTPEQIEAESVRLLAIARRGAVLVSPAISQGEKAVIRAAFDAGCPVILLRENGFAPLAKPGGKLIEACAAGRILLVAPWEHHTDKRAIKREQCLQLNELARLICTR